MKPDSLPNSLDIDIEQQELKRKASSTECQHENAYGLRTIAYHPYEIACPDCGRLVWFR